MSNLADLLTEAKGYATRGRCIGAVARDGAGTRCLYDDARAACWCPVGAIARAISDRNMWNAAWHLLYCVVNKQGWSGIVVWSEAHERTLEDIGAAFDAAILRAKESEAS